MFWALKYRTLTRLFPILFLIISQLYFCPQIYCETYQWVDKEGILHIGNSPPPDSNKKGQGENLSPRPQSVTGEFFQRLAEDFLVLPKIQVEKKYSGQIIKSSGEILFLEYLSEKNVSKIMVLVHSEIQNDPKSIISNVDFRGRDRYLVVIEYPGTEIALNYKKGDHFSFQGSYKDIKEQPPFTYRKNDRDFYIYFKPIL